MGRRARRQKNRQLLQQVEQMENVNLPGGSVTVPLGKKKQDTPNRDTYVSVTEVEVTNVDEREDSFFEHAVSRSLDWLTPRIDKKLLVTVVSKKQACYCRRGGAYKTSGANDIYDDYYSSRYCD